jgi:hypothetical protein
MVLTDKDIEFLKSKGFTQDDNKHSGYFFMEEDNKSWVLIPYDNLYKLEFYEYGLYDGDGDYYEDYDKEYSKDGESLESFISFWFE